MNCSPPDRLAGERACPESRSSTCQRSNFVGGLHERVAPAADLFQGTRGVHQQDARAARGRPLQERAILERRGKVGQRPVPLVHLAEQLAQRFLPSPPCSRCCSAACRLRSSSRPRACTEGNCSFVRARRPRRPRRRPAPVQRGRASPAAAPRPRSSLERAGVPASVASTPLWPRSGRRYQMASAASAACRRPTRTPAGRSARPLPPPAPRLRVRSAARNAPRRYSAAGALLPCSTAPATPMCSRTFASHSRATPANFVEQQWLRWDKASQRGTHCMLQLAARDVY